MVERGWRRVPNPTFKIIFENQEGRQGRGPTQHGVLDFPQTHTAGRFFRETAEDEGIPWPHYYKTLKVTVLEWLIFLSCKRQKPKSN